MSLDREVLFRCSFCPARNSINAKRSQYWPLFFVGAVVVILIKICYTTCDYNLERMAYKQSMEHYLDNSATTRVDSQVADYMCHMLTQEYGNPSSLHEKGYAAERELNKAYSAVGRALGCDEGEVYFTSGGTEANNWAILQGYLARRRRGNRVITTAIEHSSVLESARRLEREFGAEVVYIQPDQYGNIASEDVLAAVTRDTVLVSIMAVNTEVGSIMPIKEIAAGVHAVAPNALVHTDAVQAFGKIPVRPKTWGVDMVTITAHKINGPKGCGALYIKKGLHLPPLLVGGEQQRGMRPGTENTAGIAGFGMAARLQQDRRIDTYGKVQQLCQMVQQFAYNEPGVVLNSGSQALPYIVNISVIGIRSETMMHYLAQRGIYVSSGSACAKGEASHVLRAMKLPPEVADSALRISFDHNSTKEDVIALLQAIKAAMGEIARR